MKYLIVQADGMADLPLDELKGKTPLEEARTPSIDSLARSAHSRIGSLNTIPSGLPPGSAVGNMSLMGLDPRRYYKGRAPLEAKARGISVGKSDLAFRCNLVQIRENGDQGGKMADYGGGHPGEEEAGKAISLLDEKLGSKTISFRQGVSYRHLLLWRGGAERVDREEMELTPPHDISGKEITPYLPRGEGGDFLLELMDRGREILAGKSEKFNAVWFWGVGSGMETPTVREEYGLDGFTISAVDLVKGLGKFRGLNPLEVRGATGWIDTNYAGKVETALENMEEETVGFLHIEAPDEASHMGRTDFKIEAIESIDRRVMGPLMDDLEGEKFRLLLATDHITGLSSRTHEQGEVPFLLFDSGKKMDAAGEGQQKCFSERAGQESKLNLKEGYRILDLLVGKLERSKTEGR